MISLLDGLSEPFDHLDSAGAQAALREHWGIEAPDPMRLDTERDDTFRAGDVLLKVAHPRDDPAVIGMQSAALAHVAAADPGIPVQRVVATLDGSLSATVAGRHAWVLTWLDGDIVAGQDLPVTFPERGRTQHQHLVLRERVDAVLPHLGAFLSPVPRPALGRPVAIEAAEEVDGECRAHGEILHERTGLVTHLDPGGDMFN
jgi:hypothetical protein